MAENKHYIKQELTNGNVLISEDVITTIVSNAINEVEGVVNLNAKAGSDFADFFGKKSWGSGVKLIVDDAGSATIECNINIGYGQSVVDISKAVQVAVSNALESTAGITGVAIDVNVTGIIPQ